jgi:sarcosine oxidase subunit alpha
MLAGAAQTFLNRFGVKVGNRPVILTSHDSAWHAAFDLPMRAARWRPSSTPAPTLRPR